MRKEILVLLILFVISGCGGNDPAPQQSLDAPLPESIASFFKTIDANNEQIPAISSESNAQRTDPVATADMETGSAKANPVENSLPESPPKLRVGVESNAVVLHWTEYSSAAGYWVERSDDSVPPDWNEIAMVGGTVSDYRDISAVRCSSYKYRIRAVDTQGNEIIHSNEAEIEVPDTDISLELPVMSGSGSYDLSWTDTGQTGRTWLIQESGDPEFREGTYLSSSCETSTCDYSFSEKTNGRWCYRVNSGKESGACWSSPACVTVSSETNSMTLFPSQANTLRYSSSDDSGDPDNATNDRDTVFSGGLLSVGCDWSFEQGIQNFICNSAALRFNLEALSGKTVTTALLRLYPYSLPSDRNTLYSVFAFSADWAPLSITWTSQPPYFREGESDAYPPFSVSVPLEFDVTWIVRQWTDGAWPNYGFLIQDATFLYPYASLLFTTRFESINHYSVLARRPQLYLEYR